MTELHETRRRFMTYFAGIGLGTTLAPGIVWARMQDAGTQTITLAMVTEAMKLSGIALTEAELKAMVDSANQNLKRYDELHAIRPAATNTVIYTQPYREMEILALAKAYQDTAGFHLTRPSRLDG